MHFKDLQRQVVHVPESRPLTIESLAAWVVADMAERQRALAERGDQAIYEMPSGQRIVLESGGRFTFSLQGEQDATLLTGFTREAVRTAQADVLLRVARVIADAHRLVPFTSRRYREIWGGF